MLRPVHRSHSLEWLLLALLGGGEHGATVLLKAHKHDGMVLGEVAGWPLSRAERYPSDLEHLRMLPLDALPSQKISLTLGNNRISERNPIDSPVFMVHQKPETLNQTNDSLQ